MRKIRYYGICAVKFSGTEKHFRFITHVYCLSFTAAGINFASVITKQEAIKLVQSSTVYSMIWDDFNGSWRKGARVGCETLSGIKYLKTEEGTPIEADLIHLPDTESVQEPEVLATAGVYRHATISKWQGTEDTSSPMQRL